METFRIFPYEDGVAHWAHTAFDQMSGVLADPKAQRANLRHGNTWFVGVDALDNDQSGMVNGVALSGAWREHVGDLALHRAQVSVIYEGYPKRDPDESVQNHSFRVKRRAGHVDGLLPVGPDKRRFAREFHAYILGIPLNNMRAAPTVVWQHSEKIMQPALARAIAGRDPRDVDVTETYKQARREVFETCKMVPLHAEVGEVFLIHRFALHGTDIWNTALARGAPEGRQIAFFRPQFENASDWLLG